MCDFVNVRIASKTLSFIAGQPSMFPHAVAATAWGNMLGCPAMNDKVFDAIRTFKQAHIDQGPEIVP